MTLSKPTVNKMQTTSMMMTVLLVTVSAAVVYDQDAVCLNNFNLLSLIQALSNADWSSLYVKHIHKNPLTPPGNVDHLL